MELVEKRFELRLDVTVVQNLNQMTQMLTESMMCLRCA